MKRSHRQVLSEHCGGRCMEAQQLRADIDEAGLVMDRWGGELETLHRLVEQLRWELDLERSTRRGLVA